MSSEEAEQIDGALWEDWSRDHREAHLDPGQICRDGTANWPRYLDSSARVLVAMREANDWAGGDWAFNQGETKTLGAVVKVLPWLGIHANTSNSFRPETPRVTALSQESDPKV